MDISGIGNLSSALAQAKTGDAIATTMLKKALDVQAQTATQLIEALPQPANPSHLGNSVDVRT